MLSTIPQTSPARDCTPLSAPEWLLDDLEVIIEHLEDEGDSETLEALLDSPELYALMSQE